VNARVAALILPVIMVVTSAVIPTAYAASSDYFTVTVDVVMHNYYELESVKLSMPIPAAIAVHGSWLPFAVLGVGVIAVVAAMVALAVKAFRR